MHVVDWTHSVWMPAQSEYIIFNLRKMGKVDEDTLSLLREQFKVTGRERALVITSSTAL